MTNDEKAKAYDEALKDMMVIYPNLKGDAKLAVEHAFPQLRESEDERIRKWLVDYFSSIKETVWIHRDITCEQILDWLEKQKEQKDYKKLYENIAKSEWFKKAYEGKSLGCDDEQKEQKPAEKQDYSGLTDLERAIHRGFLAAGVENVPVTIIKETAKECLAQIKPAEWSEEDKKIIKSLILEVNKYVFFAGIEAQKIISFLKSLRPSWKPSEEQLEAFRGYLEDFQAKAEAAIGGWNNFDVMIRLYEQLKKL